MIDEIKKVEIMKDIKEDLLSEGEKLQEEELWAIYNGAVESYAMATLPARENAMLKAELDKRVKEVIKSLPKYAKYFENSDFEAAVNEYFVACPKVLQLSEVMSAQAVLNAAIKAIDAKTDKGELSKNSGINNVKSNVKADIEVFESTDSTLSPEFVAMIEKQGGAAGKAKALAYGKSLAENAIDGKVNYYASCMEYRTGFYANNEIALRQAIEDEGNIGIA